MRMELISDDKMKQNEFGVFTSSIERLGCFPHENPFCIPEVTQRHNLERRHDIIITI